MIHQGWKIERPWPLLKLLTVISAVLYLALLVVSPQHSLKVPSAERPMLLVIGWYLGAFVAYLFAWWAATKAQVDRRLLLWLLGTSLLWRALLLPTPPFQEIDIYRYLWDGAVVTQGGDPYRFAPQEVEDAIDLQASGAPFALDDQMAPLVKFATETVPEYETILRTIHYGSLPSPYPPVSQAVFAMASASSPFSTPTTHLKWLKLWLTAFDVGVLLLLVWLLKMTGGHLGHAVAYGWCPLVMKECAGSGHLDSITTFFAVLALALAVRSLKAGSSAARWVTVSGSSTALALGIGAKLFPVVLAPLLVLVWLRKLGWSLAITGSLIISVGSAACLAPMLLGDQPAAEADAAQVATPESDSELLPSPPDQAVLASDKTEGLAAFLSRWEINDLAFLVLVENLRPQAETPAERRPWFVLVADETSKTILKQWRKVAEPAWYRAVPHSNFSPAAASFTLARVLTLLACGIVALACAWRASRPDGDSVDMLRAAFLTLAWFWLLAPTQNPWYWCWAVPLLPFARGRAWALLAGCAMLYYLRFWLEAHYPQPGVFGTPYNGSYFFFFVMPWIEFGPWYVLLVGEAIRRKFLGVSARPE